MKINWEEFGFRKDYDEKNRIVKQEYVTHDNKRYWVSTVDLGLNHRFGEGNPLYYETMIFGVKDDDDIDYVNLYCARYETREEAQKEHDEIIKLINENKMELKNGYFEKVKD